MEHLCPEIDRLVSCYTCGAQSLPPIKLCVDAHVGCSSCAKYLQLCICGHRFAAGSHLTFDWLVSAMKFKCKYRTAVVQKRLCSVLVDDDAGGGCADTWYSVQELHEHYRKYCTNNAYKCPLTGCSHVARVDNVTDHYETAHGPFEKLMPADHQRPDEVIFMIPTHPRTKVFRKIFNGYFLFFVIPQKGCRKSRDSVSKVTMQNINPTDSLNYKCVIAKTQSAARESQIAITLTILQETF